MKILFITISILALFSLSACKKDKTVNNGNLISNPGFENNGAPDFSGWTGTKSFSNDVPPGGGKWSLKLVPEWYPAEGYTETFVTGLSGYYTFQFSCETKAENGTGRITIRKKDQLGTVKDLSGTTFNDSTWTTLTIIIKVQLNPTDKLIVHLSAGSTELSISNIFFDNVELKIMD
jgi:hypothetical protein